MTDQQVRVTFEPHGRTVSVLPGTKVLEAAARAGLTIITPCGGQGTCGKCRIHLTSGACEPTETDRKHFSEEELADGWRLACQTAICQPAVVQVPRDSLFASQHQILIQAKGATEAELQPAVRKVYVQLLPPTLEDHGADLLRLERQVGPFKADLDLLRQVSSKLRSNDFKATAVLTDRRLIDLEDGDTRSQCYGAAFDIGTTTVVGSLLDLCTGEELALASRMNPQVSFGDDVLSRIKHAAEGGDCLAELQRLITATVSEMLEQMTSEAGVRRDHVYEVTIAGNTTMEHLLCGIDPTQLGQVPFVPVHARGLMLPARQLGIGIHHRGAAYVFPVIGGFVGGDTVACIVATKLTAQDGPVLMVDIGTNGEIVLCHEGRLWAASTAAGPAFEGARISCGMRATHGAVEKVVFDDDVRLGVIGDVSPIGLCGSGLIDLVAELLRSGIVSREGRLLPNDELPATLPAALRNRVVENRDGRVEFVIGGGDGGRRGQPVCLTQRDVRELQLAAGAIRAGISILLRKVNLTSKDLKRVLIAGGFGSFIRRSNAQRIGLLPTDIDHQRIQYVGNASLNGARWALLSTSVRKEAESLARQAIHVQLSEDPNFQMEFAEAMIFPQEDQAAGKVQRRMAR